MNRRFFPWFKAGHAVFSVIVVGVAIMAFSYASEVSAPHLAGPIEPAQGLSRVASIVAMPVTKEITREMIVEKTASCAEMISAKDKLLCLNRRLKMKRDFRAQEKLKCDRLEDGSGKDQCFAELDIATKTLQSV